MQKRLQQSLARHLEDPLMGKINFSSWDDLFEYWMAKEKFPKKIILVIDEFQYLAKVNPAFPSVLQRLWDQKFKSKNIFLILCGSMINMMYAAALSYSSPLYGRRTAQMKVDPISFQDYGKFLPDLDGIKRLEYYAVTGGVPKYIKTFSPKKTLWKNIRDGILSKESYLYNEPRYILNEEIAGTINYFSVLKTISEGEHKIGNIASKIGMKVNILTKYLDVLKSLEIIEREVPVTETNPEKSKMGLYYIKDHFFRFWFRYLFPNQSYLEIGETNYVLDMIKDNFSAYLGQVYEKVCLESLPLLIKKGRLPFKPEKWGRWWAKSEEIDIVAYNGKTGEILFGECKWSNKPVGIDVLNKLKRKVSKVEWNKGNRKEYFAIFAREGFDREMKNVSKKEKVILIKGVV